MTDTTTKHDPLAGYYFAIAMIYQQGRSAYNAGTPIDDCPYVGLAAQHWKDGWNAESVK